MLAALVVFQAVASWPSMLPHYANQYLWRLNRFPYKAALRVMPQEEYLRKYLYQYDVVEHGGGPCPARRARVFTHRLSRVVHHARCHFRHRSRAEQHFERFLFVGWTMEFQPTRMFDFHFPEKRMNRVRLLQTAQARVWSSGTSTSCASSIVEWKWRGVRNGGCAHGRIHSRLQLAFDNSAATRWRSWQTGEPGMYIDVDFGRAESVDEVRMETSRDYEWPMRIEVQERDAGGWITLADRFEERDIRPAESIRRAATYELLARGIHYVLVQDGDWGADDYNDDPEAWGLAVVARVPGATLFRVVP